MSSRQLDEERIFHLARELSDPANRVEYLDQICAGDQALRNRVEALLQAHEHADGFLRSGQPEPAPTIEGPPVAERMGKTIGRYRLMEKIGEGGMGIVFVAEQERPIRRKVAIKVIKPGMDSRAVIARFEAERQALAMMDHSNIAKVFDAGTTDSGHPYFAMAGSMRLFSGSHHWLQPGNRLMRRLWPLKRCIWRAAHTKLKSWRLSWHDHQVPVPSMCGPKGYATGCCSSTLIPRRQGSCWRPPDNRITQLEI